MPITVTGRLARDPDELKNGVYSITIATDLKRNKDTGEFETAYIKCLFFKEISERKAGFMKALRKGSKIMVCGAVHDLDTYLSNKDNVWKPQLTIRVYSASFPIGGSGKRGEEDEEDGSENRSYSNNNRSSSQTSTVRARRKSW